MSPEWQELLFASADVINDGSLVGSGGRWGAESLAASVGLFSTGELWANACTSAVSRRECQPGMWWRSTIAWQNYSVWKGSEARLNKKRDDFRNNKGSKRGKPLWAKTGLGRLFLSFLWQFIICPDFWLHKTQRVCYEHYSSQEDDRRSRDR